METFHEQLGVFSIETYRLPYSGSSLPPHFVLRFLTDKRSNHAAREAMIGVPNGVIMETCLNIFMVSIPRYVMG